MSRSGGNMTRREFIRKGAGAIAGATLLGSIPGIASCATDKTRRPNILFLFADQMRNCSMGCMGDRGIRTPHLDRLASQGMLFTHAISGYPLCSPYRAMLLTGRYGNVTGVIGNETELPASEITIAKVLKQQGYKTGFIGKWHLEKTHDPFVPKERRAGFDFWASRNLGGSHTDSFYCADTPEQIPLKGWEPEAQADLAIDFMRKNSNHPFCLFLAWRPPHPPREAPQKYLDMYDPKKLSQRPNVPKDVDDRENLRVYNAMITSLDDCVGKIMKALDEIGIADDTIICFSSDHGDMLASHGLQGKNVPYDESIRIPFIMRYPRRVKAGSRTDVLLNSVDVMPTLLSLCGVPVPKSVQGADLSSFALGKGGKKPEGVLLQKILGGGKLPGGGEWRGVRTPRYTYAKTLSGGWLLFDNEKDPYQQNNLIGKPEYKALQDRLDNLLKELLKKADDDFAPSTEYLKRFRSQLGKKHLRSEGGKPRRRLQPVDEE